MIGPFMAVFPVSPGLAGRLRRTRGMYSLLFAILVLATFVRQAHAELDNETSPTSRFKSRPDLHAPIIDLTILRRDLVTPGYILLAPYRNLDPGPYIYDNEGQLVWSGAGHSGPKTAHAPKVCNFRNEPHLCYFTGQQHLGFARGHGVILNRHYQAVASVEAAGAGASSDMHEFRLAPFSRGNAALVTVYQPRRFDLGVNPRFNVKDGLAWVVEGVFQEIEIETGRLLFEWRSLDHVDPRDRWVMPGSTDTSGDGLQEASPWDYFHLNSIDKNAAGDYLISARHTSAIYKLSGRDGSILWSLGGNSPSIVSEGFNFSYQHHARWVSENETHTVLSFFDNASNGFNLTNSVSLGFLIAIDHTTSKAHALKLWTAPEIHVSDYGKEESGILSGSQGNLQLLSPHDPNSAVHIGWGEHAYFSEHLADGTAVQFGKLASRPSNVMIYRSNKFNWTGKPLTKPALWTYSRAGATSGSQTRTQANDKGKMHFYTSWNGATEVWRWKFFTAPTASGPFTLAGHAEKRGFETSFSRSAFFAPWSYVQALDSQGRVLAESGVVKTFVPSANMRPYCDDAGDCEAARKVEKEEETAFLDFSNEVHEKDLSFNRGYGTERYYFDQGVAGGGGGESSTTTVGSWLSSWWTSSSSSSSSSTTASSPPTLNNAPQNSDRTSQTFILLLGLVLGFCIPHLFAFFRRKAALQRIWGSVASLLRFRGERRYSRLRQREKEFEAEAEEGSLLEDLSSGSSDRDL